MSDADAWLWLMHLETNVKPRQAKRFLALFRQ
jgi:hypothetical protein